MAYENQDRCCNCGTSIPHIREEEDSEAALCDTCYGKLEEALSVALQFPIQYTRLRNDVSAPRKKGD